MADLVLPRNLEAQARTSRHEELRRFVAELPTIVATAAERFELQLDAPFQPGGQTAWVAPATTSTGERVVLKVGWRHEEARDEAAGLRAWDGDGAVRCLADWDDATTTALLLERCVPGTALADAVDPLEADAVVAGLLRRLWRAPSTGHPFRTLTSMCAWWADAAEPRLAAVPAAVLDPGLVREGLRLWRSLPTDADETVLLATDLHAGNVLDAEREPWLVVDPKPYVGDPTYDALQHLLGDPGRLATEPLRFLRRMADLLDLDPDRLQAWLFGRCVVEVADHPDLVAVVWRLAL